MRNHLFIITIASALVAGPAMAKERASTEEAVGFGVGATVGAVAGGPVGLILGAAIGAVLGDSFDQKSTEIDSLSSSLNGSNAKVAELQEEVVVLNSDLDMLGGDIERLQAISRPELLNLMQAGIEMDLLFRTDEDTLSDSTGIRLQQLAASLATMSDVNIRLDGFADERGDATYNHGLSERRVQHVRDLLVQNGVPESRIKVTAHGESPAADTNIDSYALERKVSLTLYIEDTKSFAATP